MKPEERLAEAIKDPILSQIKGQDTILVVTPKELVYIGPEGVQRAPLAEIRRVAVAKGGRLVVAGRESGFIDASVAGFDKNELKLFFESVKSYVARARKGENLAPAPPVTEEALIEEKPTPAPPPPVEEPRKEEPPAPLPRRRSGALALLLKLLALFTWGYTAAFVYLYPGLDPVWLSGVILGGLGLGLVEWLVAEG